MLDQPSAAQILAAVARTLREDAPLSAFERRVLAAAIDIARRETGEPPEAAAAERARLASLLGHEGSLAELTRLLAESIASGVIDETTPGLMDHLWATTLQKVGVDQPHFALFRRLGTAAADPEKGS